MAKTTTHVGGLATLPSTPGFTFLSTFIPKVDSLTPVDLSPHLHPAAIFIVNDGEGVTAVQLQSMLTMRGTMLTFFEHELTRAWDIENSEASRTVLYHGWSRTVFKDDDEEVKVCEFGVAELVLHEGEWKLKEMRTVVDMGPMVSRRAKMDKGRQS
jgi:hypothetical protein